MFLVLNGTRLRSRLFSGCAGILLAAAPHIHGGTIFRFDFNETNGTTVVSTNGPLTGALGRPLDPADYPVSSLDSPSGAAADKSLMIVDPDGYLLLDVTGKTNAADFSKPITAEAWIKIPETAAARGEGIVAFGNSWKFGLRPDGRIAFTLFGVVDATSDIFPAIGSWTHLAAAWEPGVGITYYVDGVQAGFIAETRAMRAAQNSTFGIGSGGTAEPIDATIDRVRVHQALLAAADLDSVAASPKAPLASTLVAFSLNEATPPYVNAGTLGGNAVFAQDVFITNSSPVLVTDSPSKKAGDSAISFDGNDRVLVDDPNQVVSLANDDFTVQAWVKFGAQPGARSVLFFNNGPGGAISFSVTSDRHVFVTTLGIQDIRSGATVPDDGLWHHIAVIHHTGQDLRFYVDGVLGDTIAYTGGILHTRTETSFSIGSEANGGLAYSGLLDRLQLSDEALAPEALDSLAIPGVIPGIPELEIGLAVSVAWPTDATGFLLQSTTSLTEPRVWTDIGVAPVVTGDKFYVLLPTPAKETFYRLVRPTSP